MAKVFWYQSKSKTGIIKYKVNPRFKVTIMSLNTKTGEMEEKEITGYSVHKNLEMYKISDKLSRFEPFWVSKDHSLIAWYEPDDKYIKVSPIELLKNPDGYYLIKYELIGGRNYVKTFMSVKKDIIIEYDPEKTEGGDFTVKDNYTFTTHDGVVVQDSMAIYVPMIPKTIEEVKEKMSIKNLLISPANRDFTMHFKHEIVLGFIHILNNEPERIYNVVPKELHSKLNELKENATSKSINAFLKEILKLSNIDLDKKIEIIDKLYQIGVKNAFTSIKLSDFYIKSLPDPDNRYKDMNDTMEEYIDKYKKEVENGKRESFAYDIITTGSRGTWSQFKQIAIGKGYIADVFGEIVGTPVKHSLLEGLTPDEYFIAAFGSRKGIVDTASNTAKSGYQTRKLIYLMSMLKLDPELEDCGTDKYLDMTVKDEDTAKLLIGRYLADGGKITNKNYKSFIGKNVKLRSPIYCKADNGYVCHKCYGDLHKVHKSKQIGIIAAQSMGERMTQLVLRTFHIGGIANKEHLDLPEQYFKIDDKFNVIARVSGILYTTKTLAKLKFVFDDGEEVTFRNKILVLSDQLVPVKRGKYKFEDNQPVLTIPTKNKDIISDLGVINLFLSGRENEFTPEEFVLGLHDTFKSYGKIDLVHFELLASILLFNSNSHKLYRYDPNGKYYWVSLLKAIDKIGNLLHNLSFERFSSKINGLIKGIDNEIEEDMKINALAEQILFFDFDDREIKSKSGDFKDII